MVKVGLFNVCSLGAATGQKEGFNAVFYDGEGVLKAGDQLDFPQELLQLCHSTSTKQEASLSTGSDFRVLKRIQKGDTLGIR